MRPFDLAKSAAGNPDQDFTLQDDGEIKALLIFLGIANHFVHQPNLAAPATQMVTCADFPSHWIAVLLFEGHKNSIDNGYTMFGWSKSRHTMQEAEAHIDGVWRHYSVAVSQRKWFQNNPKKN